MKLVVDENIPQGKEAFGRFGEITLSGGREIRNEMLRDTDILIVRSITQVNEKLLKDTKIKFVGTATIGTDHVDKSYLEKENICFADAAGCNAFSVAEYVIGAITQYLIQNKKSFSDLSIGVVGCGNVGTKVVRFAKAMGMNVLINDPPLERETGDKIFCSLDDALQADVVTFHVPLNKTGIDKTYHLINETNIDKIKSGAMLINSSRGPVVENDVLLRRLIENEDLFTVLDVWEGEPNLNKELLNIVNIATPHIAGYSLEGKLNGTKIIYDKLCEFLKVRPEWQPDYPVIETDSFTFGSADVFENEFDKLTKNIYNINLDNNNLKASLKIDDEQRPKYFDELRKKYRIRREFSNYTVNLLESEKTLKERLNSLRFNTV